MIVEPPGEPTARNGLPFLSTIVGDIEERGRLSGSIRFGSAASYDRAEVGQLVVEQEPAAGHDDAGAAGLLDGERVLDDVAPLVGDGEVGGLDVLGVGRRRRRLALGRAARPSYDVTSPAATGLVRRGRRVDLAGPLGGELVGEQVARAGRRPGGVADVLAPVGERERARLEVVVQRLGPRQRREVVALEDVQRLADGGAAARTTAPCRRRRGRGSSTFVGAWSRVAVARQVALDQEALRAPGASSASSSAACGRRGRSRRPIAPS